MIQAQLFLLRVLAGCRTKADAVSVYECLLRSPPVEQQLCVESINNAIKQRWSSSGLAWIKKQAWNRL